MASRSWLPALSAAGLAFAASFFVACRRSESPAVRTGRPNVLLITLDTVRADHLGCYGAKGASTPTLDRMAASGVRFPTAVAHAPLTAPSHASILTSRTPLGHGVRDNGAYVLPSTVPTMAEDFAKAGYATGAFVSGFPLTRRFGFDRGFATYDDHLPRGTDPRRTAYVERNAAGTTDAALKWLEGRSQPFFLWIHYFDAHAPYEPPADFAARTGSPYAGEIAFVDAQIARLTARLEAMAPGRTIVLTTADHGESLGEHGEDTHGIFVYDSTLRVPFLITGPGVPAGQTPPTVARGIDVAPTLLDLAGIEGPPMEGRSLRPAFSGTRMDDAPTYSESLHPLLQYGWAPLHSLRTDRYHVIEAPRPELYDLAHDAKETADLARSEAARLATMRRELRRVMTTETPAAAQAIDAETAARLEALGYVGTAGGTTTPAPTGRDPKDGIGLATRLGRNGMSVARTDPQRAIRELTELLKEDPGMLVVLRTRAVAYETAGQYENAIRDLRALETRGALSAEDSVVLGDSLRLAGRTREAAAVLEGTARQNPRFAQPRLSLAAIHLAAKRFAEATRAYESVLETSPDQTEALRGLGDLALIQGNQAEAERHYARILDLDPDDPGALAKLGVVRMQQGRADDGIALFRRAVEREPKNAETLLYLAGALAASGRPLEAIPYFERSLAAGPPSTMALNGLGLTRLQLGDAKGAADAFRRSLALDANQPEVVQALRSTGAR